MLIDFGCQNGAKLAPKWGQKSMSTSKGVFFTKRTLAAAGARSAGSRGSKMGTKMDQKSSKKWGQKGKASWHRFFIDFGRFEGASWHGKSTKNRSKKALEASAPPLGPIWAHLGGLLARLGRIGPHLPGGLQRNAAESGGVVAHLESPLLRTTVPS